MFLKLKFVLLYLFAVNCAFLVDQSEIIPDEGSGKKLEMLEECETNFTEFQDTFLRGAKEDYFITYNSSTLKSCKEHCCLEKRFLCQSFSYLASLSVCYVMNVSMHDKIARLDAFNGWNHYFRGRPTDSSTSNHSSSSRAPSFFPILNSRDIFSNSSTEHFDEFQTHAFASSTEKRQSINFSISHLDTPDDIRIFEENFTTHSVKTLTDPTGYEVIGNLEVSPPSDSQNLPHSTKFLASTSSSKINCSKPCENGGKCQFDFDKSSKQFLMKCSCRQGFKGEFCKVTDKQVSAAGMPSYIIILIVIGVIIFLLLVVFLVIYLIYRKKTGKYQVRRQRKRWSKRNRQVQDRRKQNINCMGSRSPVSSELSVPCSINSTITRSTATTSP